MRGRASGIWPVGQANRGPSRKPLETRRRHEAAIHAKPLGNGKQSLTTLRGLSIRGLPLAQFDLSETGIHIHKGPARRQRILIAPECQGRPPNQQQVSLRTNLAEQWEWHPPGVLSGTVNP